MTERGLSSPLPTASITITPSTRHQAESRSAFQELLRCSYLFTQILMLFQQFFFHKSKIFNFSGWDHSPSIRRGRLNCSNNSQICTTPLPPHLLYCNSGFLWFSRFDIFVTETHRVRVEFVKVGLDDFGHDEGGLLDSLPFPSDGNHNIIGCHLRSNGCEYRKCFFRFATLNFWNCC